ncbi:unnamed protein product, partial [Rhizoctonia solani]
VPGPHFVPYTIFPSGGMRVLSASIHFTSSSILAYCVARRIGMIRMSSMNDLKTLSWPRINVVLILVISWLFVFGTGILIHGVGMSYSHNACSSGLFLCIWLYALSKVFIYTFLTEKVRVVWEVVAQPRLSSPVYLVCLAVMLPVRYSPVVRLCYAQLINSKIKFGVMPILMTIGRIAFLKPDMTCVIGLEPFSSISLLAYDLFINVFLNVMFLWPLLRSRITSRQLVKVARRNMVAAVVALATSVTNLALLTVLRHELGWVCLGSCAVDVTLNAIVIFWLTMPRTESSTNEPSYLPGQSQQTSYLGTEAESSIRKTASIKAPIVFSPPTAHKHRASLRDTTINRPADVPAAIHPVTIAEVTELRYTAALPDFPVSPTVPSTSVGNMSMLASSPGDNFSSKRRSTGLRSLGEFFWMPKPKPEKDMEVHISVVTQEDMELGDLESIQAKNDDGSSLDQAKIKSEWYK